MLTTTRCTTCQPLTTAELAAQDQVEAHRRYWNGYDMTDPFVRRMWRLCCTVLGLALMAGGYAILIDAGYAPPAPWSPLGQQIEQQDDTTIPVEPAKPAPAEKPEVAI